jgi:DNA topoisomerase-1
MGKNLVIVESPAKAKTINKILGSDYVVKASMGHVRDLPERKLGVDIKNHFKPEYETVKSRQKVIQELLEAAALAPAIYLAPDPDREGEAIAWHLKCLLSAKIDDSVFSRVTYNEITPTAVREAFAHPRPLDQNRVDAQQARRILDRIVGYKVSPLLWAQVRRGLSAGRVQSVALRLVCEREALIQNFVPEPFWLIGAKVRKFVEPRDPFRIRLARINGQPAKIVQPGQSESILKDLEGRELKVAQVIRRELTRRALPPFITSSLQQAASRFYDFTPSRTMRVAQKLYEGADLGDGPVGLITYMRTDSFNIAAEALQACRGLIVEQFGKDYLPDQPNFFKSRSSAQEAHEAIRPADVRRSPDQVASFLSPEELKLYRLIWQRFVASQMTPARIEQRTVELDAVAPVPATPGAGQYLFRATASQVVFPGYMKGLGMDLKEKEKSDEANGDEDDENQPLPELVTGELVEKLEWLNERKETQPPGRYSEASLIKALEENGVGRPSTYAQILATLSDRRYVEKEKKALKPTLLGVQVNTFLVKHLNTLFDVKFTAGMEESLDQIESGALNWTHMLEEFYGRFSEWVDQAKGPSADAGKVERILGLLERIQEWGPETKRGKRTYSDQKFVVSIRDQTEKKKPLSIRQLEALARIGKRYAKQVPELEPALVEMELDQVDPPVSDADREAVRRKLELLGAVTCDGPREHRGKTYNDLTFIESLRRQHEGGRMLSPAQLAVLDRMIIKYSAQIPDFEAIRGDLALTDPENRPMDPECGPLVEAMASVHEWRPAAGKGARVFDDRLFYESLKRQFDQRKALTVRQSGALKRMVRVYRAQIGNFEALAQQFGINTSEPTATGKRGGRPKKGRAAEDQPQND